VVGIVDAVAGVRRADAAASTGIFVQVSTYLQSTRTAS
jgi:hypothetical protein